MIEKKVNRLCYGRNRDKPNLVSYFRYKKKGHDSKQKVQLSFFSW